MPLARHLPKYLMPPAPPTSSSNFTGAPPPPTSSRASRVPYAGFPILKDVFEVLLWSFHSQPSLDFIANKLACLRASAAVLCYLMTRRRAHLPRCNTRLSFVAQKKRNRARAFCRPSRSVSVLALAAEHAPRLASRAEIAPRTGLGPVPSAATGQDPGRIRHLNGSRRLKRVRLEE